MPQFKYHAFISYSHQDNRWGEWLHKALETYPIPQRLVGRQTAAGTIPKRLAPVFRDRDELPSAHDLNGKVAAALAQSAALVVICSPRSAASRWVNEEVLAFKRLGRAERVFCLIVDGEPNASELPGRETEECFAPALRFQLDADGGLTTRRTEPIAADVRPGKDGKANARLKLVSGLLDVGFDELRQREQQRAHRKLAWVAGLALAGMLVTTGLAAFALHARNQAQFQREQAEHLVGFMLGNLRDKLNEVNRLDILDEVADHAMAYFDAQGEGSGSIQTRAKRAEALSLIGRVRIDQGRLDEATKAFTESLRAANALAADKPHDPELQMALVDAHLWLGKTDWQRGNLDRATSHFRTALPIATAVARTYPDNEDWMTEAGWVHVNLGRILEARGEMDEALREYLVALDIDQQLVSRHPTEARFEQQLAMQHGSIGQLLYAQGDLVGAERHYSSERNLLRHLVASEARNVEYKVNLAIAQTFLAQVAEALGHAGAARSSLQQARQIGEAVLAADPHNMDKLGDVASYSRRLARNLRLSGEVAAAGPLLERAAALYAQMLAQSPEDVRGKSGRAATLLEQARLALQRGDGLAAKMRAVAARDGCAALLRLRADDHGASLDLASAQLLLGKLSAPDDRPHARIEWARGLQALRVFGEDARDPEQLAVRAELLQRLGRSADAQRIIARLSQMGYREREYLAWAAPFDAPDTAGAVIRTAQAN